MRSGYFINWVFMNKSEPNFNKNHDRSGGIPPQTPPSAQPCLPAGRRNIWTAEAELQFPIFLWRQIILNTIEH